MSSNGTPIIPFGTASHPTYFEGPWADVSHQPSTAIYQILSGGNNNVPQYGFLIAVYLWVTSSGGSAGTGSPAFAADGPWNILAPGLKLTAPNGAEIFGGANWGGFETYIANRHAALFRINDPALYPSYSATPASPSFTMRIPLCLNIETGLGSLPNLDAQAPFRLSAFENTAATIYTTAPGTVPTLRYRWYIEAWTVPDATNRLTGATQEQTPPGIGAGIGTLNYWSLSGPDNVPTGGGAVRVVLNRKGNILRNLVLVARDSSTGARMTTANLGNFPSPLTFSWDGAPVAVEEPMHRRDRVYAAAPDSSTQLPGTLVWEYADSAGISLQAAADGQGVDKFVQTMQSSRIEWQGTWPSSSNGQQVSVLVNDVALVQVAQTAPNAYQFGGPIGALMNPAQVEAIR